MAAGQTGSRTPEGGPPPGDLTAGSGRSLPVLETFVLLVVTLPLAVVFHLPTLWFVIPFVVITARGRNYEDYGLTWRNPGTWRFHAVVILLVFGTYLAGHYLFGRLVLGAPFELRLPGSFGWLVADQLLAIGLPEEFFFRGYMQTHFDRAFGRSWRFAGAHFGWGLPLSAVIFAACHTIHGNPARLIVFFPGLFYGWLRARTDTIAVPAVYHAASNILMSVMLASFGAV